MKYVVLKISTYSENYHSALFLTDSETEIRQKLDEYITQFSETVKIKNTIYPSKIIRKSSRIDIDFIDEIHNTNRTALSFVVLEINE